MSNVDRLGNDMTEIPKLEKPTFFMTTLLNFSVIQPLSVGRMLHKGV